MNRFAQLIYGKVVYIFETTLTKDKLSTIFDPEIFWIDVTGMDCKEGYVAEFNPEIGLHLVPPKEEETNELERVRADKILQLKTFVKNKIENGCISKATGENVIFSLSDIDRINLCALICRINSIDFNKTYTSGYPVRGIKEGETNSQTFYLSKEEVEILCDDITKHVASYIDLYWMYEDIIKEIDDVDGLINLEFRDVETHAQ